MKIQIKDETTSDINCIEPEEYATRVTQMRLQLCIHVRSRIKRGAAKQQNLDFAILQHPGGYFNKFKLLQEYKPGRTFHITIIQRNR